MGSIRLPGTPTPGTPAVPQLRRRFSRSLALLLPFACLALFLASSQSLSLSPEPAKAAAEQTTRGDGALELAEAVAAQQEPEDLPANEMDVRLKRIRWSKEDEQLRRYSWTTPDVHESLQRLVDGLTPASRRTRDWLLRSRTTSTGGTGIGLGTTDPPAPIQPAPPAEAHAQPPSPDEGPGLFVEGSPTKYSDLVQEWKTGRPFEACEKGQWEEEYRTLHSDMLEGKRELRLLEFACRDGDYCGGIADRVLGMVTTFLYSILTGRAFSMTWEQPAPLDLLFDSPNIDWSRPFNASSSTPIPYPYSSPALIDQRKEINAHNWEEPKIDEFFPRFIDEFGEGRSTPWLQLDFNRGVVIRSFSYPSIRPHLDRLGLKLETAYSCLINYLLRPKAAVLAYIAQYSSVFSLPEYFVIGLQIRTGDTSMYATRKDTVNTVKHHSTYFKCAAAVAATYADPSQKVIYYLISDSRVLEEDALRTFPDRVVVSGLKPAHVEIKTDKSDGFKAIKRAADGFMRTVADSWIFASTDFQILTYRSGFGKIPTWLRGRPNSTIQLLNPHMDPVYNRALKKKNKGKMPPPIDCSRPEALKSFEDIAQDWSLG